jgi:carbon monoxide dehydrogenase subunit G
MRLDGTHLFNAPSERVYAALTNPDALRAGLPCCERVIQFGPPDATGTLRGEARVVLGLGMPPTTLRWTIEPTRIPRHLNYAVRAADPDSQFAVNGFVDLVAREGQTVAAYVWDVQVAGDGNATSASNVSTAGTAMLKQVAAALDAQLAADQPRATLDDALPILRADSARGRITLLPAEPTAQPIRVRLRPMLNRGLWAAAGIVAGVALLAGLAATLSLWRKRSSAPR